MEGLRDLELFLIWDNKVSYNPQVIELFEALLKHPEVEVRRKALDILDRMVRLSENIESESKLVEYSTYLVSIAKSDQDDETRSKAIRVLLGGIGDERVIEPIIGILLNGSNELHKKMFDMIQSFPWSVKGKIKRQLKSKLLHELGNPKHPENIQKRLKEFLEIIRWK